MQKTNFPEVSVVMSVYNAQQFLKRSVESILNQTFGDFEFIIVNDASSDTSEDVLKKYAEKDRRIKLLFFSQNIGLTKSLNKAIAMAEGKYIARQDADDISLPKRLEKQISFLKRGYDFCCCRSRFQEDGSIHPKWFSVIFYKAIVKYKNIFIHGSYCFKKSLWQDIGGYDENLIFAQDYDFIIRIILKKYRIKYLFEPLYIAQKNAECISKKNNKEQYEYFKKIKRKYFIKS